MTSAWRDREIARITAKQRTVASAKQLYARGISKRAIEYRLISKRLRVVFRGVYTVAPGELPPLALEQAALLACGERSFISHHSAAFVWGLRKVPPAQVEVSVVGRCSASRKEIRVHRIKAIGRGETRRHEGLWISSPARAVLEVAATASVDELVDIVNEGQGLRRSPRASWRQSCGAIEGAAAPGSSRRYSATRTR